MLASFNQYGQVSTKVAANIDSTKVEAGLEFEEYRRALYSFLSSTVSGQQLNSVGGFASLDIAEGSATFSPSFALKDGLISAELKGAVTDGFTSIFTDNKLNTSVSASFQYHFIKSGNKNEFLIYNSSKVQRKASELAAINRKIKKQRDEWKLDSLRTNPKIDELRFKIDENKAKISTLEKEIKKPRYQKIRLRNLNDKIELNEQKVKDAEVEISKLKGDENKTKRLEAIVKKSDAELKVIELRSKKEELKQSKEKIESKKLKLKDANNKLAELNTELENHLNEAIISMERQALTALRNEEVEALNNKYALELTGINLKWFSLGYSVKNDAFYFYDPAKEFDMQIESKNALSQEFHFQWTSVSFNDEKDEKSKKIPNHYWNNGIAIGFTNNLSELSTIKINQSTTTTSENISRVIGEEYNAFTGKPFKKRQKEVTLSSDLFYFLSGNKFAFHLFPRHTIKTGRKPETDFTAGLFFSFKDKDPTKASPINVELFYNFRDIFNTGESTLGLTERNNIGLRFTFPINIQGFTN